MLLQIERVDLKINFDFDGTVSYYEYKNIAIVLLSVDEDSRKFDTLY